MKEATINTLRKVAGFALEALRWTFAHKSLVVTILRVVGLGTIATVVGVTADTVCSTTDYCSPSE